MTKGLQLEVMNPHSALEIGNEFISRSLHNGRGITQMHVQKFVYLSHGYCLAATDYPLITEPVEAWAFGPVVRRLYDALKVHGRQPVSREIHWGDDSPLAFDKTDQVARAHLTDTQTDLIERVWDAYSRFTAFQLSALTHMAGTPWRDTFVAGENKIIDNYRISNYFKAA